VPVHQTLVDLCTKAVYHHKHSVNRVFKTGITLLFVTYYLAFGNPALQEQRITALGKRKKGLIQYLQIE